MKKLLFATLIIGVALFASCSNDDVEPTARTLTVDAKAVGISNAGETKSLKITSNTDWEITGLDTGITATPSSGTGDMVVSITMPENSLFEAVVKNLTVKVKEGTLTAPVTVTQAARDALTLTTDVAAIAILSGGETKSLKITSNTDWEITGIDEGITVNPTSGTGDMVVSIKMTVNETFNPIVKNLTVKVKEGTLTAPVTVTQEARDALTLTTDVTAIDIPSGGETKSLKITSNTDWEITGVDAGITVTPTSGKGDMVVSIMMPVNSLFEAVVKNLTVKVKEGTLTAPVTVTQEARDALTLTTDVTAIAILSGGETKSLKITSNTDWEITGIDEGITVNPTNGKGDMVVSITMPVNSLFEVVVKNLTVKVKEGTLTAPVTVTQEARDALTLTTNVTAIAIPSGGETKSLKITSNTDWVITGLDTGITATPSSGTGDMVVSITMPENSLFEAVVKNLTVKVKEGTLTAPVTVTQEARDALTLTTNVTAIAIPSGGETKSLKITSNTDWVITGVDAGITVTPTSGTGDMVVSIIMGASSSGSEIIKNLVVESITGGLTVPIKVTQAASPTLVVTPLILDFVFGGESHDITVTSNTDWEITGVDAGITATPTSGKTGATTVSITMPENMTFAEVVKNLIIKVDAGTLSKTVKATQAARPAPELAVGATTLAFVYGGESHDITVTSNTDWEITGVDAGITATPTSGKTGATTVSITMSENMTFAEVVKILTVKVKVGTLTKSVKSTQAARPAPELAVGATTLAFTDVGESKNLVITSNADWEITGIDAGITATPSSGTGNKVVYITMPENTSFEDVVKTLTVKVNVGALERTVTATQAKTRGVIHIASAGRLASMMSVNPTIKTASRMQITGVMNEADFDALRFGVKATLKYLDISGLNIYALPKNAVTEVTNLETVILPTRLTSIGELAFSNCKKLTTCVIPAGVTTIGQKAFANCNELAYSGIPAGLTKINAFVFYGCYKFTTVTIPAGVTSIGQEAFAASSNLKEVICLATTPPTLLLGNAAYVKTFEDTHADRVLKVPAASLAAYQGSTTWTADFAFPVDKIVALP